MGSRPKNLRSDILKDVRYLGRLLGVPEGDLPGGYTLKDISFALNSIRIGLQATAHGYESGVRELLNEGDATRASVEGLLLAISSLRAERDAAIFAATATDADVIELMNRHGNGYDFSKEC